MGLNDMALTDDVSFLELGIIDSTGVIELIAFLEERYGIRVEDAEMTPENLDSLDAIEQFVARKTFCRASSMTA
ncbi:acyl carrier protein [Acidiferrobacter sp.]|uniref:acyl carrier protein n=1 Tax=Acidiferrobacter sp. TaxID=1872107 RepID=UPI002624F67A|nr:acyl carrier protein [Acidiferrobacter sp.]